MYTEQECEVDVEHFEQHRTRLRARFLAGQTPEGQRDPERLDGLQYKREDDRLLKLISGCEGKLRFSRFQFAQKRAAAKQEKDSRPTKGNGNKGMGLWYKVSADEAIRFKQQGRDVRCTGVKTWEVFQ